MKHRLKLTTATPKVAGSGKNLRRSNVCLYDNIRVEKKN